MKFLTIIFAMIFGITLVAQDCGTPRIKNNGGETSWIDYNSENPADPESTWIDCEERVFIDLGGVNPDGEAYVPELIYVKYPYQTGKVELLDTSTGEFLLIYPWHITPDIAERFGYEGDIPNPEDIYVHVNPMDTSECPTKNYYEIRYRKNELGQLQYKWRYTELEYYVIGDPFLELPVIGNGQCLDFGDGDTYTPLEGTKFTRIYDGSCDKRLDTNGDALVVSGSIMSYAGGTLDGLTFFPTEPNWELIFTGTLKKEGGQFADFIVEQIK